MEPLALRLCPICRSSAALSKRSSGMYSIRCRMSSADTFNKSGHEFFVYADSMEAAIKIWNEDRSVAAETLRKIEDVLERLSRVRAQNSLVLGKNGNQEADDALREIQQVLRDAGFEA